MYHALQYDGHHLLYIRIQTLTKKPQSMSQKTEGIEAGFVREEEVNRAALVSSMKLLYMLCKEEIPHTTKYPKILEVVKDLGVESLAHLEKGGNAKYTSERYLQEALSCFGDTIWEPRLNDILQSPFYSIMIDETTDVEVKCELIIYVRYLKNGKSQTSFARVVDIQNGKAETIKDSIMKFLSENDIPIKKMCALGSDGAAVMVGSKAGVGALLRQDIPHLLANHCVAHRLALASSQAAAAVPYLKRFKNLIEQLYYFYSNSSVRTSGLREIQTVLDEPQIKVTQAKDVRWLSHDRAVQAVRRCLPSIITSLEREASERDDCRAHGLSLFIQTYDFVAGLYMMCDVLPVLSALSRAFQTKDAAFSMVRSLVNGTIATVKALKENPGEHFSSVSQVMDNLVDQPFRFHPPTEKQKQDFTKNTYQKFMDAIVDNLEKRFPDMPLLEAFNVFNAQQWPECEEELRVFGNDSIELLSDHFQEFVSRDDVKTEYLLFKNAVRQDSDLLKQPTFRILEEAAGPMAEALPNLAKLAAAGLLLPTSTADCERGFSVLKRVKTPLRNRLCNKTLQSLLMISVEGPETLEFDYQTAVNKWAAAKKRRLSVQ